MDTPKNTAAVSIETEVDALWHKVSEPRKPEPGLFEVSVVRFNMSIVDMIWLMLKFSIAGAVVLILNLIVWLAIIFWFFPTLSHRLPV